MMVKPVSAHVPEFGLSSAAIGLGLPVTTSKGGIIRASLAILAGKSRTEAISYVESGGTNNLTMKQSRIVAEIPEELLVQAEQAMEGNTNKSYMVRVALAMAAGFSEEQARDYAYMERGRPRKNRETVSA
jgi:hypothetical protein